MTDFQREFQTRLLAFPAVKMAAPARQRAVNTAQEALEIVMQSGSDDEGEEGDVVQHDEENEDELFEDACADKSQKTKKCLQVFFCFVFVFCFCTSLFCYVVPVFPHCYCC